MSSKAEIAWRRETEDGTSIQVYARRFGGDWKFFTRLRRFDDWEPLGNPPLDDWLALFDAVRRRVPRRLITPASLGELRRTILMRFPHAELPEDEA